MRFCSWFFTKFDHLAIISSNPSPEGISSGQMTIGSRPAPWLRLGFLDAVVDVPLFNRKKLFNCQKVPRRGYGSIRIRSLGTLRKMNIVSHPKLKASSTGRGLAEIGIKVPEAVHFNHLKQRRTGPSTREFV